MGYFDFDGVRYWDIREKDKTWFRVVNDEIKSLPSDATKRTDGIALKTLTIEEAQQEKERLEKIQRNDRLLREKCEQRRLNGGPKFEFPV